MVTGWGMDDNRMKPWRLVLADGAHVEVTREEAEARATDFAGVREIVPPGLASRAELTAALRAARAAKDALDKRNDQLLGLVGLMSRCRNVRAMLRCGKRLELSLDHGVIGAEPFPFTLDDVPDILAHLDRDPRDGDLRWVMERRAERAAEKP